MCLRGLSYGEFITHNRPLESCMRPSHCTCLPLFECCYSLKRFPRVLAIFSLLPALKTCLRVISKISLLSRQEECKYSNTQWENVYRYQIFETKPWWSETKANCWHNFSLLWNRDNSNSPTQKLNRKKGKVQPLHHISHRYHETTELAGIVLSAQNYSWSNSWMGKCERQTNDQERDTRALTSAWRDSKQD